MSIPRTLAMAMAGLLFLAPTTRAQDIEALEKKLRSLAEETIPKTVLIKAIVGPGKQGAGSGAIISADGYILTCSHVVEIGKKLEVVTSDGTKYVGKLLGRSVKQDYALVKIEAKNLATFKIGDSSKVKKGDWVVALGHPGGPYKDVQPAFAAGKVRGLDMKLPVGLMQKYYNHAIMTDVPIFAGDSGGPLINGKGELIGINGAIVMINEMAFAIPINQIMKDLPALKQGKVIQGEAAGPEAFREMQKIISPQDYQKMMQRSLKRMFGNGKNNPFGNLMDPKGPFGKLFKDGMPDMGDLFKDGMPDLGKLMDPKGPFGKILEDLRKGKMPDLGKLLDPDGPLGKLFKGRNGKAPDLRDLFGRGRNPFGRRPVRPRPVPRVRPGGRPYLGLSVVPQGKGSGVRGLVVNEVKRNGPAHQAGIRKGDVVTSVAGQACPNVPALIKGLRGKKPGDVVKVKVQRAYFLDTVLVQKELTIKVTLGRR